MEKLHKRNAAKLKPSAKKDGEKKACCSDKKATTDKKDCTKDGAKKSCCSDKKADKK